MVETSAPGRGATRCRAILVAAPSSGTGKTSVTAALARRFTRDGHRVRAFKVGPDFLDPMVLECATGAPVHQLDLWMVGESECARRLYEASLEADIILVEGVMGLYDGDPSGADLAQRFRLPVAVVVDAGAMAQTFAAVATGLLRFRPLIAGGVIANRIASERHAQMVVEQLPADITFLGSLPKVADAALPERHLGLVQAREIGDLERRIDAMAAAWTPQPAPLPPQVDWAPVERTPPARRLAGVRIAVARDAALSFIYRANLELLEAMGATLAFFSILEPGLPACDALYLPGGYPELHAQAIAANAPMKAASTAMHAAGRPILAECGGMMCLAEGLTLADGTRHAMFGLLPAEVVMQTRLSALGLQEAMLPEGAIRGHTFHYSKMSTAMQPLARALVKRDGKPGEAIYRSKRLTASYVHLYFASNPEATAALFAPDAGADAASDA